MAEGFDKDVTSVIADTLNALAATLRAEMAVGEGGDPAVITQLQDDVAALETAQADLAADLAAKVEQADIDAAVAGLADAAAVNAQLATKADTTAVNEALAGKASTSALTSGLAGKVSQSTYDAFLVTLASNLAAKADASALTTLTGTVNSQGTAIASKMDAVAALIGVSPTQLFYKVTRQGDATATSGWSNIIEVWWDPTGAPAPRLVAWFNEYGELRLIPGNFNTVPLRVYAKDLIADPDHTGMLIEIVDHREGTRTTLGGFDSAGKVSGPNIGFPIKDVAASAPSTSGWEANTFWWLTTGETNL